MENTHIREREKMHVYEHKLSTGTRSIKTEIVYLNERIKKNIILTYENYANARKFQYFAAL